MPAGLNTQTDREIRYEHRIQKKLVEQHNMERDRRAEKRNTYVQPNRVCSDSNITMEVRSEISRLARRIGQQHTNMILRDTSYTTKFSHVM